MSPKHKISAIRLSEKISKNPSYAKCVGIEIQKTQKKEKSQ